MPILRRTVPSAVAATLTIALTVAACTGGTAADHATGNTPSPAATTGVSAAPPAPELTIGTWRDLADLPERRTEIGAAALDGRIYVGGGLIPRQQLATGFFIYDPDTDTWREAAPLPEGRHHAPMVAHDGKVYLVGGYRSGALADVTASMMVYDVASDTWRHGPFMPQPRAAHAVAATADGTIHVFGGVDDLGVVNDHFVFDVASQTWSTLPELPTPREHVAAAYLDGVIYVAAGRHGTDSGLTAFEAYDIASDQWRTLPDVPTGRSGIAVAAFDGQVYVFGGEVFGWGESARTFAEAERFDPATERWQAVAPMRVPRHGLGAGALDRGIVVVGGGPVAGFTYSAVTEFWRP